MTRSRHRARRVRRTPLAGPVAVLALLVAVLALPSASSAFSATTANPANVLAADGLLPPSALSATQTCATPAPIALRGAVASTSLSPLVLNPPPDTQPGNVLVAQVAYFGATTITAPSGWNRILADTSGGSVTSVVYWKLATASEPAATFSRPSSNTGDMVGGVVAYSGVDRSSPVADARSATGSGETATSPALTTTATDAVIVHFLTKRQAELSTPAGIRGLWKLSSDTEGATAADEPFAGPGAIPSRSSTSPGVASEWIVQSLVLRRAAGTPSAGLSWTASPSSWATGYRLERVVSGTVQLSRTVTPVGQTSTTDGPLVNGAAYTYRLSAYRDAWTSPPVTATLTPSC